MAIIVINDSVDINDLAALLDRVKQGDEILFKDGGRAVAVMHPPLPAHRNIQEGIALCPPDSPPVDEEFTRDVEHAVAWHRESLDSAAWD